MKKIILILSIFIIALANSQTIESIQKGYYNAVVGDTILQNRTTERKAKDDGINYVLKHNLKSYKITFPDYVQVDLSGFEKDTIIIEEPPVIVSPTTPIDSTSQGLVFPDNAYFLKPNSTGDFTKEMIDNVVSNGENYIVFDSDTLNIHYEKSGNLKQGWLSYIRLDGIKDITLDLRKTFINCFPSSENKRQAHRVFLFENCENIILKAGKVEGDKFKRTFDTPEEMATENTIFIRSGRGSINIIIDGGDVSGFMGDVESSSVYGSKSIAFHETEKTYYLQPDGRYESIFYNIDTDTYKYFGLTGGVGYYRLLKYDMDDVTFKFYDENNKYVTEINNAKYFGIYQFPEGVKKIKVNVNAMDGRTESPTYFGHRLEYNPNNGTVIKNMKISDNHRGGVANIGASATIENNEFFNTKRYFDVPLFSDTTRYHINCEDAVSRDLVINNNTFSNKFHKILLTHNISADITNNTFIGDFYNIFIYNLIEGNIQGNNFISKGVVNGGAGTNNSQVIISDNIGSPEVQLTSGAVWKNNNFSDGKLKGRGKAHHNIFKNYNIDRLGFTKEIHDNEFIGITSTGYTMPNSYIYKNRFKNVSLRFQHGDNIEEQIILDGVEIDNTNTPETHALYRNYSDAKIIAINSTFKGVKIKNRRVNESIDFEDGNWYFKNCTFTDIENYLIVLGSNLTNNIAERFYFKNCTFIGSGLFASNTIYSGMNYEIVFDNCTIDPNITMPSNYTNATITMPTIVEPRTQQTPKITRGEANFPLCTIIRVGCHYFTLKIRNKNTQEIVLDKIVASGYLHYNDTPNDFEYSIDGGVYWDSL